MKKNWKFWELPTPVNKVCRKSDIYRKNNGKLLKKRYEQKIDAVAAMLDAYVAYKLNREAFD